MRDYKILIDFESMELMRGVRKSIRDEIRAFIVSLAVYPESKGDFTEYDSTDREIQVKILGSYAIFFWADTAVREIKVTEIRKADQA